MHSTTTSTTWRPPPGPGRIFPISGVRLVEFRSKKNGGRVALGRVTLGEPRRFKSPMKKSKKRRHGTLSRSSAMYNLSTWMDLPQNGRCTLLFSLWRRPLGSPLNICASYSSRPLTARFFAWVSFLSLVYTFSILGYPLMSFPLVVPSLCLLAIRGISRNSQLPLLYPVLGVWVRVDSALNYLPRFFPFERTSTCCADFFSFPERKFFSLCNEDGTIRDPAGDEANR
eukprot:SAG11_NODE_904_length_6610_cov_3.763170_2_plen_226_part_01